MGQATLKGGITGCGAVTTTSHLPAWQSVKDAKIIAVCDHNEEVARQVAKQWGIRGVYHDLSQMLDSEELNFIDICTPPQTHLPHAMQAMEAGLHVLVEKPMTVSVIEADEMVSAAKEHNIKLCAVHNALFYPVVQTAKSLVDNGSIGDLISMDIHISIPRERLNWQSHWTHDLPGGSLGENAPHAAYLTSAFLGTVGSIQAIANNCNHIPWIAGDELKVLVKGENGIGSFNISYNASAFSFSLTLAGTEEKLHLDLVTQTMTRIRPRSNRTHNLVLNQLDLILQSLMSAAYISAKSLMGQKWYKIGHGALIKKFINSIHYNLEPPVPGEDGRETIRILEQIWPQISQDKSPLGQKT